MFVKFTKKDGAPVWLNPEFVVTVEAAKGGGTIVVPFGDGLDYEVKESVSSVLAALEGGDCAEDVPPEPREEAPAAQQTPAEEPAAVEPEPAPAAEEVAQPVFDAPAGQPEVSEEEAAAGVAAVAAFNESQEKPDPKAVRRARKAKAKPAKPGTPATDGERKSPSRRRAARKTPLELSDEQVDRLRKMAPRSVNKLMNVLKQKQFAVPDPETTIKALVEHDILFVDDQTQHVEWIGPAGDA